MKYLFFKQNDISVETFEKIFKTGAGDAGKRWSMVAFLEDGWCSVYAEDDFDLPVPNIDINHVYDTFIKMPAAEAIEPENEPCVRCGTVSMRPDGAHYCHDNKALDLARTKGYNSYILDRHRGPFGRFQHLNPYTEPKLAREWLAGREMARIEFDPAD